MDRQGLVDVSGELFRFASIKERVVLHRNDFLLCVQVLRLIASNGAVPEGTSLIPLDLSTPDVEEASRRDSESLFRIVEGYRAKSVPQGAVEKLAELALDKLSATTSDLGHLQFIEYDDVQLWNVCWDRRSLSSVQMSMAWSDSCCKGF